MCFWKSSSLELNIFRVPEILKLAQPEALSLCKECIHSNWSSKLKNMVMFNISSISFPDVQSSGQEALCWSWSWPALENLHEVNELIGLIKAHLNQGVLFHVWCKRIYFCSIVFSNHLNKYYTTKPHLLFEKVTASHLYTWKQRLVLCWMLDSLLHSTGLPPEFFCQWRRVY